MAHITDLIREHLNKSPDNAILMAVQQAGCRAHTFQAKDLPRMKADGRGVRFGKIYYFAGQVKFGTMRKVQAGAA